MSDPILSDRALEIARRALDGLALQQEIIGHNLANVDTPGYRAQSLDFQSALRRALSRSQGLELQATHPAHLAAASRADEPRVSLRAGGSLRADGNNVDIEVELSQMAETGIAYQAITQLVSKKFLLLKNIVSGR
jgi:flagellar basal-body rod protein FlgB